MKLIPQQPYSFDLFYQIHARYPHPSLFRLKDGAYYRAIHNDGQVALAKVSADGDKLYLQALHGDIASEPFAHILGIHANLQPFYTFAQENEQLWAVVEPLLGLPLYASETVYEALIFVIIEQHISWVNAQKAQRVLVEWGDNSVLHEGEKYYAMPTAQQLANASIDDLRPLKITFKRMQLMIDLSQQVIDGTLDLEGMRDLSNEQMYKELLKIKGIGHWTASVVIARAKGEYAYVPHNDVALQAAVAEYFDVEKSAEATKTLFESYGEFAGLAAHFTLMKWVLDKYPVVSG